MRLIGSLGFVVAQKAVIGVEYEYSDYTRMWLDYDGSDVGRFDHVNDYILDNYRLGGALKIGGEYRLDNVSIRAGYHNVMNPYSAESRLPNGTSRTDFSQHTLTCGLGFRFGSMTLDLAYANTLRGYNQMPYSTDIPFPFSSEEVPYATLLNVNQYKESVHQFLVSLGFRF